MTSSEMLRCYKQLYNELHSCTEDNPCCDDEDQHNRKLSNLITLSVRLQKFGIDINFVNNELNDNY